MWNVCVCVCVCVRYMWWGGRGVNMLETSVLVRPIFVCIVCYLQLTKPRENASMKIKQMPLGSQLACGRGQKPPNSFDLALT